MQTISVHKNARPDIVRRAIETEMCNLADGLGAALFLCGSQFYAGQGEDYDYRMVLPSPLRGLSRLCGRLPGARRLLSRLLSGVIGLSR